MTVDNNLMAGGGYVMYGGAKNGTGNVSGPILVENNHIARGNHNSSGYFPDGGEYGLWAEFNESATKACGNSGTTTCADHARLPPAPLLTPTARGPGGLRARARRPPWPAPPTHRGSLRRRSTDSSLTLPPPTRGVARQRVPSGVAALGEVLEERLVAVEIALLDDVIGVDVEVDSPWWRAIQSAFSIQRSIPGSRRISNMVWSCIIVKGSSTTSPKRNGMIEQQPPG